VAALLARPLGTLALSLVLAGPMGARALPVISGLCGEMHNETQNSRRSPSLCSGSGSHNGQTGLSHWSEYLLRYQASRKPVQQVLQPPVLGANGGGEAIGIVGSTMLAGATLNMCHEIALRDMRADRG
jgi:hypothetical protein